MTDDYTQEQWFVWKICNFSFCFHKNGESIKSPVFKTDSFGGSEWQLEIYPRGEQKESDEYISIYLQKTKNDVHAEECTITYELEIIGGDGRILDTKKSKNRIYKENGAWGFEKLIKITSVSNKMKNWPEDTLTLRCHLFCHGQQSATPVCEGRTDIIVDRCSFVWNLRIPDSSFEVASKEFEFSKNSLYEITVSVQGDMFRIYIHQKQEPSDFSKVVTCKISLIDSKAKELTSKIANHLFDTTDRNNAWKFPTFITRNALESYKYAFVETDTICLLCKFVASNGSVSNAMPDSKSDTSFNSETCLTLQVELGNMLMQNLYSDVQIKTGNEILPAHKCVLAARSPVFYTMFQQDMIETKTSIVDISDIDTDTLKQFLEFLYTERVGHLEYENATKLIFVAEKYQVISLKEKCALFLESDLSLGNICEILPLADLIKHERLKDTSLNFVASNSQIILNLPEWSSLVENNAKLATEVFTRIVQLGE